MFFFFFDELYYISEIKRAFENILFEKMLKDGYFDMRKYISGRIKKENMLSMLEKEESKYALLYKKAYPVKENAFRLWNNTFGNIEEQYCQNVVKLTIVESEAIVNWVFQTLKTSKEREDFAKRIFHELKDFYAVKNNIRFARGVVYNAEKVDVHFCSSISEINKFISKLNNRDNLFFRGHSDANYSLMPSVYRTPGFKKNESKMYNEILINYPVDFEKCHTHLEKLVKMQHYGLPTRLLDITRNPLVALYFACESNFETYGELVLISVSEDEIKYSQSDSVSILSSLATFSDEKQAEFYELATDPTIDVGKFNRRLHKLVHEVKLEKPAFLAQISKQDILRNYIVYALKNNNRIIKQDGAFILCGLPNEENSLENFRYREDGKKVIVLLDDKERILRELDEFSINRASLFPEIDCVAEYLKNKYIK